MIVALVTVVVVVGTVILWSFFGDVLSHRSHTAAGRCVGGKEKVAIVADPSIAEPVQQLAESFNSSAGPVGDHCMVMTVKPAGSDAVLAGFIGKWPAELGGQPALWIPGSSVSAARLAAATGRRPISDSRSLVTSPVMLAVRPELQHALGQPELGGVARTANQPECVGGLEPAGLGIAAAGPADRAATATPRIWPARRWQPRRRRRARRPTQGTAAVRTLLGGQPKLADNSLAEAMNTLLKPGDAATAPVHAVITTEQQLFQRGQSLPDAKGTLGSWLPSGPVPVADYPTVLLGGSWVSSGAELGGQ